MKIETNLNLWNTKYGNAFIYWYIFNIFPRKMNGNFNEFVLLR